MKIKVGRKEFEASTIKTPNVSILVIVGKKGLLGCGYVNHIAGDKFGDAVAIVRGVNSYDDMLEATVAEVNGVAADLGVHVGMSGKDALAQF